MSWAPILIRKRHLKHQKNYS